MADGDGANPTLTPGEESLGEVTELNSSAAITPTELSSEEASTEGPTMEENPFGGSENSTAGSIFTPRVYDQTTGSGMQPSLPEEETTSPTAPVGQPEETQHIPENEGEDDNTEHDVDDARTECKINSYK